MRAVLGKEIGRIAEMRAYLKTPQGGHECTPEEIKDFTQEILSS
jgi:hypothetical protein